MAPKTAKICAGNRIRDATQSGVTFLQRRLVLRFLALSAVLWAILLAAPAIAMAGGGDKAGQGGKIYALNCARCHGAALEGKRIDPATAIPALVPTPEMPGQVWRFSDLQIMAIIKQGGHTLKAPGETVSMPVFGESLSDLQIRIVIAFVKSHWPEKIRKSQRDATRIMARASGGDGAEKGAAIFTRRCAICHGYDLGGRTQKVELGGRQTLVHIPSLTVPREDWKLVEKKMFRIIKFGEKAHPSPASPFFMPPFKQVLSDREIRTVLSYLKAVWELQTEKTGEEDKSPPPATAP